VPTNKFEEYRVLFTRAKHLTDGSEPGDIVIAAADDGWNDFGFKIHVDILIHPKDERITSRFKLRGFLGFAGAGRVTGRPAETDTRLIDRVLDGAPNTRMPAGQFPEFFTMLADIGEYRTLVRELGPGEAAFALLLMHDMVEAERASTARGWLQAQHEPIFQRGFLRSNEAYFALKNAGPLLHGLEFEEIGRISNALNIKFQLAGRPNAHQLEFRFDIHEPVLPKRFAVVIGANGVGKSQALGPKHGGPHRSAGALER
jgi:hypothetical protein